MQALNIQTKTINDIDVDNIVMTNLNDRKITGHKTFELLAAEHIDMKLNKVSFPFYFYCIYIAIISGECEGKCANFY